MADFPVINGRRYSRASGETDLDGQTYSGVQAVKWKQSLKSKKVYGQGARAVGRTKGQKEDDGSITMLQQDWEVFKKGLAQKSPSGLSFGIVEFDTFLSYSESDADPVIERTLKGCRVEEESGGHEGEDENKVELTLSIMDIVDENGISILAEEDA